MSPSTGTDASAAAPAAAQTAAQAAQAASLSQLTGGAPAAASAKVTAGAAPATGSTGNSASTSAGAATTAQGAGTTGDLATASAVTAPGTTGGNSGNDAGTGNGSSGNQASQQQSAGAPLISSGLAPQAHSASAASGGQTADASSASTQTDSASATGGTQTAVALGPLGNPTPFQQVPITAQGAGTASSGAATPPGTDPKTLALDPATGGNTALTGDVASAATAAATQGIVQTEGPSAANTTTSTSAFSLSQAAAANPAEQVKVQVTKGMKDGSDSIDVLLHPADLGTVQVKLQMQDGQVKATISADNPQTLALLKNDAHQLTQSLQNAGFNTDSNSLNFQMRGEQQASSGGAFAQQQDGTGQNGSNSSDSGSSDSPYTTDSEIDEQVLAATGGTGAAVSGLDIKV
jgi:flagellar hook-length control protein FliK